MGKTNYIKRVLLCPANYFKIPYEINPWMKIKNYVLEKEARLQWRALRDIYKDISFQIEEIDPQHDFPDMVFTANGFFNIGKKALLSRFRFKERQGETKFFKNWLVEHGYEIIDPENVSYEGQGDTFLVAKSIFQGWGFRSEKMILPILSNTYADHEIVPLHLVDNRFYHLDTCFFPVAENLVYYYENAFDPSSMRKIRKSFVKAIAVSDEEALSFSLNSVAADHKVVMNAKARKFADRVKSDGFRPILTPMDEFLKSGGSVKCLTNEIWD